MFSWVLHLIWRPNKPIILAPFLHCSSRSWLYYPFAYETMYKAPAERHRPAVLSRGRVMEINHIIGEVVFALG